MDRSTRGYIDKGRNSKREKNLQKLARRKKKVHYVLDKGNLTRVIKEAEQVKSQFKNIVKSIDIIEEPESSKTKRLKALKAIREEYLAKERSKRKNLIAAENERNKVEAGRLRRELDVLEDIREKRIDRSAVKAPPSKNPRRQKLQQAILDLERQKKILQNQPSSDLDASRKAILYIEGQRGHLENILAGKVQLGTDIHEILKAKKTIRELMKLPSTPIVPPSSPPPTTLPIPTPTPPPMPTSIRYNQTPDRAKRERKIKLRTRNIQREILMLQEEIARSRRSKGKKEAEQGVRRDRSIGPKRKGKEERLVKLEMELQSLLGRKPFKKEGRLTPPSLIYSSDRSRRSQRRLREERITEWKAGNKEKGHSDIYLSRRDELAKYSERIRNPRKVVFLIMVNQEEYNYISSNGWLKSLGGYNEFAVGIASVSNKVTFNREDACDIYVDISQIASEFQNSSDIPKEAREKIELLCYESLQTQKLKASFSYISTKKLPFERPPKLICVIPIHRRVEVTIETVNRLKQQKYLDDIILVGDSHIEEEIARETGVTFIQYYNEPLSYKLQVGIDVARMCNPDAIMISGSDNWLASNWCELCVPFLSNHDVIGANQWWSARIIKGAPLEIIRCTYNNRFDPIGGGRIVTAQALNKIDWGLYAFSHIKGLDGRSWNLLREYIKPLNVKIVDGLINLGVKGSWGQRDPYESIKASLLVSSRVIKSPEKWLDANFEGWNVSFRKFEPSYKRRA